MAFSNVNGSQLISKAWIEQEDLSRKHRENIPAFQLEGQLFLDFLCELEYQFFLGFEPTNFNEEFFYKCNHTLRPLLSPDSLISELKFLVNSFCVNQFSL